MYVRIVAYLRLAFMIYYHGRFTLGSLYGTMTSHVLPARENYTRM